jgi:23S rRNA (cytosine1962-C5)-methyltransferase
MNEKKRPELLILTSPEWEEYELLDSGGGAKLERYGPYRFVRPEPEALWQPALAEKVWKSADARFISTPEENGGHWDYAKKIPERWMMSYKNLKFWVQLTASRHMGVFPEQACQWDWIQEQIKAAIKPVNVLNLFGYTGLASMASAEAGAKVTHVDAARKVVTWANENMQLSRLQDSQVRWVIDDVIKFVRREARRGIVYDGLILDPPKFGRGPKGEVWEFYKLIPTLLEECRLVLNPNPLFVLLTAYAVKASALTLYYEMNEIMAGKNGTTSAGEVVLEEKSRGRLVSMAIFARWAQNKQ